MGKVTKNISPMKQNAVYCRGFVSDSASNYVTFKASWYQHTNRH